VLGERIDVEDSRCPRPCLLGCEGMGGEEPFLRRGTCVDASDARRARADGSRRATAVFRPPRRAEESDGSGNRHGPTRSPATFRLDASAHCARGRRWKGREGATMTDDRGPALRSKLLPRISGASRWSVRAGRRSYTLTPNRSGRSIPPGAGARRHIATSGGSSPTRPRTRVGGGHATNRLTDKASRSVPNRSGKRSRSATQPLIATS